MTDPDIRQQLGMLIAQNRANEQSIGMMRQDMADMRRDVMLMRETIASAKGGWKMLFLVASIAGTLGALSAKFLGLLWVK